MHSKLIRLGHVPCSTHTIPELLEEVKFLIKKPGAQPRTLLCVNAHIYRLAAANPRLRSILEKARVVTADGIGIVLAAQLFGVKIAERCNMTEAFRAFLQAKDFPSTEAVLFGVSKEEAYLASRRINQISSHCKVVAHEHGFLPEDRYIQLCAKYPQCQFVFVGMGTPRTEYVSDSLARSFPRKIVWGVGAGTLRIFAGTMREAPLFWRRAGLQWLYRLLRDPRNLWERYTIGHMQFMWRVLRARFQTNRRRSRTPLKERQA